jgi:hypothetical protein
MEKVDTNNVEGSFMLTEKRKEQGLNGSLGARDEGWMMRHSPTGSYEDGFACFIFHVEVLAISFRLFDLSIADRLIGFVRGLLAHSLPPRILG